MDGNLIKEGLDLMAVGMGVVFAFLILMVVLMNLAGAFFQKFSHWFAEPVAPVVPPPVAKREDGGTERIAVAIAAAHRARHKP